EEDHAGHPALDESARAGRKVETGEAHAKELRRGVLQRVHRRSLARRRRGVSGLRIRPDAGHESGLAPLAFAPAPGWSVRIPPSAPNGGETRFAERSSGIRGRLGAAEEAACTRGGDGWRPVWAWGPSRSLRSDAARSE